MNAYPLVPSISTTTEAGVSAVTQIETPLETSPHMLIVCSVMMIALRALDVALPIEYPAAFIFLVSQILVLCLQRQVHVHDHLVMVDGLTDCHFTVTSYSCIIS